MTDALAVEAALTPPNARSFAGQPPSQRGMAGEFFYIPGVLITSASVFLSFTRHNRGQDRKSSYILLLLTSGKFHAVRNNVRFNKGKYSLTEQ